MKENEKIDPPICPVCNEKLNLLVTETQEYYGLYGHKKCNTGMFYDGVNLFEVDFIEHLLLDIPGRVNGQE